MTLEIGADNVNIATDKIKSIDFPTLSVTGALTPGVHRRVGINPSLNSVTALLPTASTVEDVSFLVMRITSTANTVTLQADGGDLINGQSSFDLALVGDFIEVVSDGTGWRVINFGDQSIINPFVKPNNVLVADGTILIGNYNVILGGTTFDIESLTPGYNAELDIQMLICNLSGSTITINTPVGEDIYLDNGLTDTHDLLDSESMVFFPTSSTQWAVRSQRDKLATVAKTGDFDDLVIAGVQADQNVIFDTGAGVYVERPIQTADVVNLDSDFADINTDTLKVGDGATTPATDTIADFESTTGAVLLPRMTTAERDLLTPLDGMILYNTTSSRIQGYNGTWSNL